MYEKVCFYHYICTVYLYFTR